jgi:outer membrane protein TolC
MKPSTPSTTAYLRPSRALFLAELSNIVKFINSVCGPILFLLLISSTADGQKFDALINKAWSQNKMIQSKTFSLNSAEATYREAKSMHGPTVNFGLQYTLAAGGRTIDLPIGDLLNPVYGTLNQLTNTNNFPQIENTAIQFLPHNFYDAKVVVRQPIYYPDLKLNADAKQNMISLKALEIKAYKRLISHEVMQAYIQYRMAQEARSIYDSGLATLQEAQRITSSMIKNGIATPVALSRLENQEAQLQVQITEATYNLVNAERWLRFNLGVDSSYVLPVIDLSSDPTMDVDTGEREELSQLLQAIQLNQIGIQKEEMFYRPRIGVGLDLGSQAFNFGWQPYGLLGFNVDVNLFDNKRHKHKIDQYRSDISAIESQKSYVEDQFTLNAQATQTQLISTLDQVKKLSITLPRAKKIYDDVVRRYKEGNTPYFELTEAQSQLIQTQILYSLARHKAWIRWADYVYATASYPIQ